MLGVAEAMEHLLADVEPVQGVERTPLKKALGRILAEDILSPADVPRHRNSAMDGYAIRGSDIPPVGSTTTLTIAGTSWAGRPFQGKLEAGQCTRIFTGAVVPEQADTIVMQEQVTRQGNHIVITPAITPYEHIRHPGDDLQAGQRILEKGRQLDAADLGLLASIGTVHVSVKPKIRVAFFSTGDELRPLGSALQPGELYESNRYTLHGLLQPLAVEPLDMGVIPDRQPELERAFAEAAANNDVIITTGGVSVGDADLVKPILEQMGHINFWKIAMKPGKPLAYGAIGPCRFFGLPGNPVSVMVTFLEIVRPALMKMMGARPTSPLRMQVPCRTRLRKVPGRQEFQRGLLARDPNGMLSVSGFDAQGSHILSSMSRANCFIILPADCAGVEAGNSVEVEPFDVML
jgi:molybdopterin molybdotransferase